MAESRHSKPWFTRMTQPSAERSVWHKMRTPVRSESELERARAQLRGSLAWASEQGIVARGGLGDPSTTSAIEGEAQ